MPPELRFITTPLAALLIVGVLALLCRWAFGAPRGRRGAGGGTDPDGYGLLLPVVVRPDAAAAEAERCRLAAAGIRATVAAAGPGFDPTGRPWPAGAAQVLVFPADLDRAASLIVPDRPRASDTVTARTGRRPPAHG